MGYVEREGETMVRLITPTVLYDAPEDLRDWWMRFTAAILRYAEGVYHEERPRAHDAHDGAIGVPDGGAGPAGV